VPVVISDGPRPFCTTSATSGARSSTAAAALSRAGVCATVIGPVLTEQAACACPQIGHDPGD
jgi:hypothetical protein